MDNPTTPSYDGCNGNGNGNSFFKNLLDALPEHVLVVDGDNHVVYINNFLATRLKADKTDTVNIVVKELEGVADKKRGKVTLQYKNGSNTCFFITSSSTVSGSDGNNGAGPCSVHMLKDTTDRTEIIKEFYESAPFMVGVTSLVGENEEEMKTVDANEETFRYLGYRPVNVKDWAEETRKDIIHHLKESRRLRKPTSVDVPDAYGLQTWHNNIFWYLGEVDGVSRFGFSVQDVSMAKIMEKTYMDSPTLMGICDLVDDETDIISWQVNRQAAATVGFTREDLLGKRLRRDLHMPAAAVNALIDLLKNAEAAGVGGSFELNNIGTPSSMKDGSKTYWKGYIYYEGPTAHNSKRFAYMAINNTELKVAKDELRKHKENLEESVKVRTQELIKSEERFRNLVANAPCSVMEASREGIIQYCNRNPGDTGAGLTGSSIYEHLEDPAPLRDKVHEVARTGCSLETDVKVRCPVTFEEKWFRLQIGPTIHEQIIIISTEITPLKKLSEELQAAMTAKSSFLANMSHEVRTPLSGIVGMGQLLGESNLTPYQRECVDTIIQCGKILGTVINDVLDFSKIEANTLVLEYLEMDLRHCMEGSLRTVIPGANKKRVELVFDYDSNCPNMIFGDENRLCQITVNLLNNAVKFTESGCVILHVESKPSEVDHRWLFHVSIRDTGIGIPKESQGKLFQMFSQVDSSTTRKHQGTGLGLAVCKRLVELMNGRIWVESTGVPGEGCTFHFEFLQKVAPTSFNIWSDIQLVAHRKCIYLLCKAGVLQKYLENRLQFMGFVVFTCTSHDHLMTSIRLARQSDVGFIMYDSAVPEYSTMIRDDVVREIPVVLLCCSHLAMALATTSAYKVHKITKPVLDENLIDCVTEILCKGVEIPETVAANSLKRKRSEEFCPDPSLNILIAEDNPMNQRVLLRVLERLGFSNVVEVAVNGQVALDCVERKIPDLIFMDVCMPLVDGIDCTKQIRQKLGCVQPFIVAMTANVFPEDQKKCMDAGMDCFLTKPIKVDSVRQAISLCMEKRHAATLARSQPQPHILSL